MFHPVRWWAHLRWKLCRLCIICLVRAPVLDQRVRWTVQWLCKMLPLFEVLLLHLIGFFQSCPISVTPIQGCWHIILWTDQLEGHSSLWTTGRAGTKCLDPISLCYVCPQVLGFYVAIWLLLMALLIACINTDIIHLIGHWWSDEMLRYLHLQV